MRASSWLSVAAVLGGPLGGLVQGLQSHFFLPVPPLIQALGDPTSAGGNASFEQLVDHSDPGLGTFSQQYWWNATYWKGPGSPVVIFTPGEVEAAPYQSYLTNGTIVGQYAQKIGAATVLLEHRYYGDSSPFPVLDNKALQHLTLNNSVADMVHFARTVELPFDSNHSSNAPQAPWIQVGGSYSGALAAWTEKLSPGTYWAYHASSAPVEAVYNYWSYFLPLQNGMPKNCTRDLERIVDHVDEILGGDDEEEIANLKDSFGLGNLTHADDFAAALAFPLGDWQSLQFYSNYSSFYQMCDTLEGVRAVSSNGTSTRTNNTIPRENGVGLDKALPNFAAWFKTEFLPGTCKTFDYAEWNDTNSVDCFDTYNKTSPMYTDLTVRNSLNRQWFWYTCNEPLFYWQTGAPEDRTSIVSRLVTPEYFQRQCDLFFPGDGNYTYGSNDGRTAADVNRLTEGWDRTDTTRVLWVNGGFDPWRSASVSSELRPGGPLEGTPSEPVHLIPGSRHCNDMSWRNGDFNKDVRDAQLASIDQMVKWVGEFSSRGGDEEGGGEGGGDDDWDGGDGDDDGWGGWGKAQREEVWGRGLRRGRRGQISKRQ